ncbi:hypothetical protein MMC11_008049 [Xylographa trunciseda]|nr:hypothetical protein [Xylographa trunciseda]
MSRSSAYTSLPGDTRDENAHLEDPPAGNFDSPDLQYSNRDAASSASMASGAGKGTYVPLTVLRQRNALDESMARSSAVRFVSQANSAFTIDSYAASIRTIDSEYTTLGKGESDSSREFSPRKQLLHLLSFGFLRFLVTGVLVGGLYTTLWLFESKSVMNELQKKLFNTIVTALSIALGINIASSFKNVAIDTRWFFLSRKRRPLKEASALSRIRFGQELT